MPSVFPNGIEAVVKKTGWPIVAHNRYWSNDTDYATQVSVRGAQLYVHTYSVVSSTLVFTSDIKFGSYVHLCSLGVHIKVTVC